MLINCRHLVLNKDSNTTKLSGTEMAAAADWVGFVGNGRIRKIIYTTNALLYLARRTYRKTGTPCRAGAKPFGSSPRFHRRS